MRRNTTRVTADGQIAIPKTLLARRGITVGTRLEVIENGEEIVLRKAESHAERRSGEDTEFRDYLKSVQGSVDVGMSTDDYMKLLRGE